MNLDELKEKCRAMFIQRAHVAKLKAEKTEQEKILTKMSDEIIETLEANDLKNFDTGFGKVSRVNKPYAKIIDKYELTKYLKEREVFDDLYSFNAAKMNSFYNEELERAKAEGNIDFKINGMDVSSNKKSLSVRGVTLGVENE